MIGAFLPKLIPLLQQTQAQAMQARMQQLMQQHQPGPAGLPPQIPQPMAAHPPMQAPPPQAPPGAPMLPR
jgi:hypothetical protein